MYWLGIENIRLIYKYSKYLNYTIFCQLTCSISTDGE